MTKMYEKCPDWFFKQSGVIPYIIKDGKVKVVIITSRSGNKWIIPKGVIEPKMTPWDSAAKEALEEAGVKGKVFRKRVGKYVQKKWGGECNINIYLMKVSKVNDKWDEDFRKRKVLTPGDAADKISIKPLRHIIKNIEKIIE